MPDLKLLVIVNNFPPDVAGGAEIFNDMCQSLAERGFDVTVRCAYPYYPEWRDKSGLNGFRIWRYRSGAITVERYGLFIPANPRSVLKRLIHEFSFFLSLLRGVPSMRRYDLIMAYCPAVSCLASAALGKILFKKPVWLNIQDLAAQAAVSSGLAKPGLLVRFLQSIQSWLFNCADVWSTISDEMAQQVGKMRRKEQPLLLIPNWLHSSLSDEIMRYQGEEAGMQGSPVRLLYSGNIGIKQNLLEFIKALASTDIDFEFVIHGNGATASEIEAWIESANDQRFLFGPFLDEKGFVKALNRADYFVIPEMAKEGAAYMPSKLISGIATATPILAVSHARSPLGREVRKYGLGPHLQWNELEASLPLLFTPSEELKNRYKEWVQNCQTRYMVYDRGRLINRYSNALHSLYRNNPVSSDY